MFQASLIISAYDKQRELDLIYHALSIQTHPMSGIEIIIAEDGANSSMRETVSKWTENSEFNIKHLTQEDKGFRKNRILNKAVRESSSPYLIFIDGDCIPHPEFIKGHISNIEAGIVLCGRRVNLTARSSKAINEHRIKSLEYSRIRFTDIVYSALNKGRPGFDYNAEEGLMIRSDSLRQILTNKDEHILGCNFSLHKDMLKDINGFDENYAGPGLGEDSDIEYRLRLTGAKFASVRNLAVVYHMYHKRTIEEPANMEYFLKVKASGKYKCTNGLVKL